MGHCNFKNKKSSNEEANEGMCFILFYIEKMGKNHFTYLYAIGKGGFGRV